MPAGFVFDTNGTAPTVVMAAPEVTAAMPGPGTEVIAPAAGRRRKPGPPPAGRVIGALAAVLFPALDLLIRLFLGDTVSFLNFTR